MIAGSIERDRRLTPRCCITERTRSAQMRRACSALVLVMMAGSVDAPLHGEEVTAAAAAEAPAPATTAPPAVAERPADTPQVAQVKANETPQEKRRRELIAQHGPEVAEAILAGKVIKDMTFEQVLAVRGVPTNKQVIPPDAELWSYPDAEVAFSAGKVSYVGLSERKPTPRPDTSNEGTKTHVEPGPRPAVEQGSAVPRPTVRVGDTYAYESRDPDNVEPVITTKRTVISTSDGILLATVSMNSRNAKVRKLSFDQDWNLVSTRNADNGGFNYSPPVKYFDFPLFTGKTWRQISTESDTKTGKTRTHTVSGVVGDWEDISVPAGTFRTIRVSLSTEVLDSATGERVAGTDISWYAPQVRRSVKSITSGRDGNSRVIQLMWYQLAEQR